MFTQISHRLNSGLGSREAQSYAIKQMSSGTVIPLRGVCIVGKLRSSDIVLSEGLPSRRHALLSLEGGQLFVEDLKSQNGTFVNGFRISVRTKVYGGCRVRFDIDEYLVMGPPEPDLDLDVATRVRTASPDDVAPQRQHQPPLSVTVPIHLFKTAQHQAVIDVGRTTVMDQSAAPPAQSNAKPARDAPWSYKEKTVVMTQRLRQVVPGHVEPLELVYVPTLLVSEGQRVPAQRVEMRVAATGNQKWNVGADAGNEIQLSDERVSGKHAAIHYDNEKWKIVDLLSKNGTLVNGARVVVHHLSSGDKIHFGPLETTFILPAKLITLSRLDNRWRSVVVLGMLSVLSFALTALVIFGVWHMNLLQALR